MSESEIKETNVINGLSTIGGGRYRICRWGAVRSARRRRHALRGASASYCVSTRVGSPLSSLASHHASRHEAAEHSLVQGQQGQAVRFRVSLS